MEKNLTARALSIRIEKKEWYITRMLNGKIDPSLQVICKIAEVLRVSVAELFTKKRGLKKLWDLSGPTMPKPIAMGESVVLYCLYQTYSYEGVF